ncbi:MAG TPA: DUF3341 domain-containing protein [Aggregatilinea sp.]|uniref:quinol:electron acceptor oxidoreductase subunit ActD n=1 Tax=Aggregatilinea sp. TaxID=2806333 RepID=UPI002C4C3A3A|nr:quinol:electron acceptor oxidoreductase subunit ActD [Aggregatilinea sp.]HML20796.1 DUF3341 domain-containing protein [Aggregatilinea sp.]
MADTLLLGLFDDVAPAADAIHDLRELGVPENRITVMSNIPYTPKMLGLTPPRQWFLPFIALGALGGAGIAFFITYITPYLYEIHVGGQPLTPFAPSAIMYFEFTALGSMVMAFLSFLLQNRFPVLRKQIYDERITDGYIGVQTQVGDSLLDAAVNVFEANHARILNRESAKAYKSPGMMHLAFWGAVGVLALGAVLTPLLLTYRIVKIPWLDGMNKSPAIGYQEGPRRAEPEGSVPINGPVLIAGQPASERIEASEESVTRGQMLFDINCAMCHGLGAGGDGPLKKYLPEIPALTDTRIQDMSEDEIFLVITLGRNRMPAIGENLTPGETWDVVNYVHSLGATSE